MSAWRARVDHDVTVRQIQQILQGWLKQQESKDLQAALGPEVFRVQRGRASPPDVFSSKQPLWLELVKLCPECRLSPTRTTSAILAMNAEEECLFGGKSFQTQADDIGGAIRATVAKIR
ncbi:unnamed protein product, partial [Prorocentrum cordatum]